MFIDIILYLIYTILCFVYLENKYLKALSVFIIINILLTLFNYLFYINSLSLFFYIEYVIMLYFLFNIFCHNVKDQCLSKKNINLIFYKPRTFRQYLYSFFGVSVASAGIVVYNKHEDKFYIYQMRYESKTICKIELDNNKLKNFKEKYLTINTDIACFKFNKKIENKILKQKARQFKTLFIRLNCLRSFRFILKTSNKFKYQGEILPSIYLLKLKIKKVIKNY